MDGKAKKRLEVIQKRLEKLRLQLSGALKQNDDPQEVADLRKEIETLEAEARRLRES